MKKIPNIDAILFDLMGVLLFRKSDYLPDQLVDEVDAVIGSVTDDAAFKRETMEKYKLRERGFNDTLTKIVDKYEPYQKLWDMLPALKMNYKLAVINNGTALTLPLFDQTLHFKKHFDLFISSAEEGLQKPDTAIFITTAERLGVAPERCLFMDDAEKNIIGAKRAGLQTIWWPDKETGFREFSRLIGVWQM